VHLLAHYFENDDASLFYMQDGKVKALGTEPETVLASLMGGKDEISKLSDFTGLPAQLAAISFATQCLKLPGVADGQSNGDPQAEQSRPHCSGRILDYGAGKGRLLLNLCEEESNKAEFIKQCEYFAWDYPQKGNLPEHHDACVEAIKQIYGTSEQRYFYPDKQPESPLQIDHAIMCNVLHEIHPRDWESIFAVEGILVTSLKDDGHLWIVEDLCMPVGERAYEEGFLVLDGDAVKKLFNTDDIEISTPAEERYQDRLMAYKIPKAYIANVSVDTIKAAVEQVKETARAKIMASPEDVSFEHGKKHAFWLQQFATAELLRDSFSTHNSEEARATP
jgi:hypothetical protein